MDTSVLLKNIPRAKFIKTASATRVVYFHNLTREFIDDVISVISIILSMSPLFYQCLFVYIIERTLHGGLKI